jgi:formiminoglutamase
MFGKSSSPGKWWSVLEPAAKSPALRLQADPDDPRLGEFVQRWQGGRCQTRPGQPIIIGFCCDEGIRRNRGRTGAAAAPDAIRECLYRFTTWDAVSDIDLAALNCLDLGNLSVATDLEEGQHRLAQIMRELLRQRAVPIVLGGGHETAFGHFLGYAEMQLGVGIINFDAHLDVRPYPEGSHSGSPFRQAMEYAPFPLKPGRYVVLGAQRQSVARSHWQWLQHHQGRIYWLDELRDGASTIAVFEDELQRLEKEAAAILVTVDADAFRQADVPGTSAASPLGFDGALFPKIGLSAGMNPAVQSFEVVEINPRYDRDNQSVRWAALGIRQFLVGLAGRGKIGEKYGRTR